MRGGVRYNSSIINLLYLWEESASGETHLRIILFGL